MGSGIAVLATQQSKLGEQAAVFIGTIALPLFVLWMWLTTYYVLDNDRLIIKYGPFRKIIPLNAIRSVRKTSNPLSSPALSLKRLEIVYGLYHTVLISPKDRDAFIDLLRERCPNMER
ncbi:PH domain-containing protein [Anoxybacteroides tepidamans]|uniref:PH domain-containing protein n=1 Tax=Anoxybacteroides tepidamans TaxID=265948 RepID=UPI001E5F0A07|nr:PH domain-containing protein [Anoxybacillus tepidamans]